MGKIGIRSTCIPIFLIATSLVILTSANPPRTITPCRSIDAAFSLPTDQGQTFFLSGRQFIEYSFRFNSEKKYGRTSRLGIAQPHVQAAVAGIGNDVIILEGCSYHRYDASNGIPLRFMETINVSDIGLPCDVDAAIKQANQTTAFKGCNSWKLNPVTGLFEPDGLVTSHLLPCDLDAALEWRNGIGLFIKGHQFWTSDLHVEGPFHMDDLNICSWYLCGEADWMLESPQPSSTFSCNGDPRLCPLRLDQVTLAGLHNAGAGFYGGFGIFNCWMRNHGLNITRQLEIGGHALMVTVSAQNDLTCIRHLDIDPCHETCGLLGTCHSFSCGGSICMMLKQIRHFLKMYRHDVITLNFNHEIVDARKVFRLLTKQLKVQFKPMLNSYYRQMGSQRWPTLYDSVRANRRIFVFYAPIIANPEYRLRYGRNLWIHNENLIGSTWRPFRAFSSCQQVVNLTSVRCDVRQYRELVEVSIIPEMGACISTMASYCRPHLHDALRACQPYRFRHGKSPNVVLVDYPEIDRTQVASVFSAVHHQNVRNVIRHRGRECRVTIDAAVTLPQLDVSYFFVGNAIVEYNHNLGAQTNVWSAPDHLQNLDAAYESSQPGHFYVVRGCQHQEVEATSLLRVMSSGETDTSPCPFNIQAAVRFQNVVYTFHGCQIHLSDSNTVMSTTDLGLPCHIEAAMASKDGGELYIYKGNNRWTYNGHGDASYDGSVLNWNVDVVTCQGTQPEVL